MANRKKKKKKNDPRDRARPPEEAGRLRPPLRRIQTLWLLRLMIRGRYLTRLIRERASICGDASRNLGIPSRLFSRIDDEEEAAVRVRRHLSRSLESIEKRPPPQEPRFARNLFWIGQALGLEPIELEILAILTLSTSDEGLKDSLVALAGGSVERLFDAISVALAAPAQAVRRAFSPSRPLVALRVIQINPPKNFSDIVEIPDGLRVALLTPHSRRGEFFDSFCRVASCGSLTLDDFPHLASDLEPLRRHLEGALDNRAKGINVLIHGAPGTGKSELARALAVSMNARLFEVPMEGRGGESLTGQDRLVRFGLAQRLLAGVGRAFLVFDELEDAFPASHQSFFDAVEDNSQVRGRKGWTNRLLEESSIPTIWVGNSVHQIDRAYLRRFDLILETHPPSRIVRKRILERHTGALPLCSGFLDRISSDERLRPADASRAARVTTLARPKSAEDAEKLFCHAIESGFAADGRLAPLAAARSDLGVWDPAFANTSAPLENVVDALRQRPAATLLLQGLPGTGKSAFVAALAERIARPLLVRRGSDLLSMWVGGTEKLIADAFRRARADRAVLFIDEADSFLQDRRSAIRSWELTQTNELLQQMEAFDGVLACATNLVERLDRAAFRRFALKIRFDPLRVDQRWSLLLRTIEACDGGLPDDVDSPSVAARLRRLGPLTAGDFAAVTRRLRLFAGQAAEPVSSKIDAFRVISELEAEIEAAGGKCGKGIGFAVA